MRQLKFVFLHLLLSNLIASSLQVKDINLNFNSCETSDQICLSPSDLFCNKGSHKCAVQSDTDMSYYINLDNQLTAKLNEDDLMQNNFLHRIQILDLSMSENSVEIVENGDHNYEGAINTSMIVSDIGHIYYQIGDCDKNANIRSTSVAVKNVVDLNMYGFSNEIVTINTNEATTLKTSNCPNRSLNFANKMKYLILSVDQSSEIHFNTLLSTIRQFKSIDIQNGKAKFYEVPLKFENGAIIRTFSMEQVSIGLIRNDANNSNGYVDIFVDGSYELHMFIEEDKPVLTLRNSSYTKISIRNNTIKISCSKEHAETLEYNKVKDLDIIFDDSCPKAVENVNDLSKEMPDESIEEDSTMAKMIEATTFKMVKEDLNEITEIITKPNLIRTLYQEPVTSAPMNSIASFSLYNQKIFLFIPLLVIFNNYLF